MKEHNRGFTGMLLTIMASFSFSIVVLLVKILNDYGFDRFGTSFWGYAGTTIPMIPFLLIAECRMRKQNKEETDETGRECNNKASSKTVLKGVCPLNVKNDTWKRLTGLFV
jgi:hypothetical protein